MIVILKFFNFFMQILSGKSQPMKQEPDILDDNVIPFVVDYIKFLLLIIVIMPHWTV